MKKLLAILALAVFFIGCATKEAEKAYHPTDDVMRALKVAKALKVMVLKLILD